MTKPRVYLLSTYTEDGSSNVAATLDRMKVPALLMQKWPDTTQDERLALDVALVHGGLLDGANLCAAWGGVQLHVVELE